jgi:Rrf2 family protein
MRMAEGVEWAVHCTGLLAALPTGATLPGKALAEFHGVSESYLLKHRQALTGAGILQSVPGPKGSFRLARPADRITLLDIVEALERAEPAFRCTEIRRRGPAALGPAAYRLPCAVHAAILRAEAAWKQALRGQTVADIVGQVMGSLEPRAIERATTWLEQNVRR